MKKSWIIKKWWIIFIVLGIVPVGIVFHDCRGFTFKRTPETILESMFGISLKDFDYTVDTFEEQGNFSDGQLLAVFKFNQLTQENIDYLKEFDPQPLPIPDTVRQQWDINAIPKQFLKAETGYYFYRAEKIISREKIRDFKIFIIDTENKRAVLYNQFV